MRDDAIHEQRRGDLDDADDDNDDDDGDNDDDDDDDVVFDAAFVVFLDAVLSRLLMTRDAACVVASLSSCVAGSTFDLRLARLGGAADDGDADLVVRGVAKLSLVLVGDSAARDELVAALLSMRDRTRADRNTRAHIAQRTDDHIHTPVPLQCCAARFIHTLTAMTGGY